MLLFGNDAFFKAQLQHLSGGQDNSSVRVLLHSTNADDAQDSTAVQHLEPLQLTDRMWFCRIPDDLRDFVYQACESPGVPNQNPFRQYGQLYTVALFLGPLLPGLVTSWDAQGEITPFVTFSQLVHPTSSGFGNPKRFMPRFLADAGCRWKFASPLCKQAKNGVGPVRVISGLEPTKARCPLFPSHADI